VSQPLTQARIIVLY